MKKWFWVLPSLWCLLIIGLSCLPKELEDNILIDEAGNKRLMMVLNFTPYPKATEADKFPDITMPVSTDWDCDDAALFIYEYFSQYEEYDPAIVIGDLQKTDENILHLEFDHVWVIVNVEQNYWIAYDWGKPCFDEQHYEGCIITYDELLKAIEYDKK